MPFPLVLWRALTRTVRRVLRHEELFSGNRESLRMALFSRESILWWVLTTFHRRRKQYRELFDTRTSPKLVYVEFRNLSEAQNFLTGLEKLAALGLTHDHLIASQHQHLASWDLGT